MCLAVEKISSSKSGDSTNVRLATSSMVRPSSSRALASNSRTRDALGTARAERMLSTASWLMKSARCSVFTLFLQMDSPERGWFELSASQCRYAARQASSFRCPVRASGLFSFDLFVQDLDHTLRRAGTYALAVDADVGAVLAAFKTEAGAHVEAVLEALLVGMAEHGIQHMLRTFQIAIGSQANADLDFVCAARLRERQRLVADAAPALIGGVQKVM